MRRTKSCVRSWRRRKATGCRFDVGGHVQRRRFRARRCCSPRSITTRLRDGENRQTHRRNVPGQALPYISIPVEEGEIYKLGKLDFQGELLVPKEDMIAGLKVKSGDQFNRSKLGQDIQNINNFIKTAATPTSTSRHSPRLSGQSIVDLTFDLQQGKRSSSSASTSAGNTKTRDKVIRRELKIVEGELYSSARRVFQNRVKRSAFRKKSKFRPSVGTTDERIEVNIEVTERPTGTFQVGAGFSSIENFIAQPRSPKTTCLGVAPRCGFRRKCRRCVSCFR